MSESLHQLSSAHLHAPPPGPAGRDFMARNRFVVLAGDTYYPAKWKDFRGSFKTEEEALAFGRGYISGDDLRWFQVIDMDKMKCLHSITHGTEDPLED